MFSLFLLPADISESRLQFAKQLGADHILAVELSREPRSNAEAIVALLGYQPDVTIECSGAESSLQTAVYVSAFMAKISDVNEAATLWSCAICSCWVIVSCCVGNVL